jgi:hypothetical protein
MMLMIVVVIVVVMRSGEESRPTLFLLLSLRCSLARSPRDAVVGLMLSDLRASLRRLRANHEFLPIKVCDDIDSDKDRER